MRYNSDKRTFENHQVCSRQLLVRLVNDLLIRSGSRFSTKDQFTEVKSSQAHFSKPPIAFIHWQENLLQTHPSQTQRDNRSVERMSDPQTNATTWGIRLLGTPQLSPLYFYTSVGRAATQPLVDRASNRHEGKGPSRANKHGWTHSMTHMLNFFEQLFAHLPPLVFDFRSQQRPKVVIHTDVSFSEHRNGMWFLLFDQETKS